MRHSPTPLHRLLGLFGCVLPALLLGQPAAPRDLYVTPTSNATVALSWLDLASNETGFRVERSTDGVTFSQVSTPGADTTFLRLTGQPAGATLFYRVLATASGGVVSAPSNVAAVTLPAATDEVILDNNMAGQAGVVGNWDNAYINQSSSWGTRYLYDRNTNKGAQTVTYTGTPPSAGTFDLFGWMPRLGAGGNFATNVPVALTQGSTTTNFVFDQNLIVEGWTFLGRVELTADPITIVLSNTGTTRTVHADAMRLLRAPTVAPPTPANLTAEALGPGRVTVRWTDGADETSYEVEIATGTGSFTVAGVVPTNGNRLVVSGLTPETSYRFRVRALNSVGPSAYSGEASATTTAAATRRLWVNAARIAELQAALATPGSHHAQAMAALLARVQTNDWRVYEESTTDGNWNYARSWLAREAAAAYLLTGQASYANQAYQALELMYTTPDPDNRLPDGGYSNSSNADLSRAMTGVAFAMVYDLAYPGLTPAQRDWVRGKLVSSLNAWPTVSVPNATTPNVSNHIGAARSAELIIMLALNEEESRVERFNQLISWLRANLDSAYTATLGWSSEGTGYADFAGMYIVPAVLALRSIGRVELDTAFNRPNFWRLPMYAYSGLQHPTTFQFYVLQSGVDGGAPLNQEGWLSALLGTVPANRLPHYRWFYDRLMGVTSPLPGERKFDRNRGGTVWSIFYYPTSGTSEHPAIVLPLSIGDSEAGLYFFRNRWQDENDIMVSAMSDLRGRNNAWDCAEAFQINLFAYGTKFIGGPGRNTSGPFYSALIVNNNAQVDDNHTGSTEVWEAQTNGGGYLIANGGSKYSNLGLTAARRHTLVDFDGEAAPLVLSTLDRVEDADTNTYGWQLALGDDAGNHGLTVTAGEESGRPTFEIRSASNVFVKGWVLSHPAASVVLPVGANDPLRVNVTGSTTDIWVAMVVGQGTAPTGTVSGTGLSSELLVGGGRIRFDTVANRIISETNPNAPTTAFANWRTARFGAGVTDEAIVGRAADPDRDGWPNRLEAVLGTNPLQGSGSGLSSLSEVDGGGQRWLVLTATETVLSDLLLRAEASRDASAWSSLTGEPVGGDATSRQWRFRLPVGGTFPEVGFIRLVVEDR